MLTVAKIKAQSAGAYTTYLESRTAPSERGDYDLQGRQRRRGARRWVLGPLGAAALGLDVDAALTSEAFSAVMNGNHPLTGLPLRAPAPTRPGSSRWT